LACALHAQVSWAVDGRSGSDQVKIELTFDAVKIVLTPAGAICLANSIVPTEAVVGVVVKVGG